MPPGSNAVVLAPRVDPFVVNHLPGRKHKAWQRILLSTGKPLMLLLTSLVASLSTGLCASHQPTVLQNVLRHESALAHPLHILPGTNMCRRSPTFFYQKCHINLSD